MEIAALIISVIALILSISTFIRFEAKELSTHQVQLVPADSLVDLKSGKKPEVEQMMMDFDDPRGKLDLDEQKYFESLNKKV